MGSPHEPDLVPPENQPGHHPPEEQDKPDLDAFAAKLGTDPKAPSATNARKAAAPRKASPAKATPSKSSSRPAATNPKQSPAPPPTRGSGGVPQENWSGGVPQENSEVTSAKRPAAVLAPTHEEAAHFSVPQPEPEEPEPRLVGLVLLPLRETVKRLEQLERKLTERLATKVRGSRGR